jgi:N-acetylmuramoyl-L-alanine amidase
MKLIHKFKSPNFNYRNSQNIELIIIHYTAIKSTYESIKHLCSKKNKVSSHYLISKNGQIFSLVSEKNRAWHAGKSYWRGKKDINSISIGIELDYFPFEGNKNFTIKLQKSLILLLKKIVKKYNILAHNILGHSDISPYRKIDPGKNFPWHILQKQKIVNKLEKIKINNTNLKIINNWFSKNKFNSDKGKILFMLNFIGYDISLASKNKFNFIQLINAYCSRYRYYKNYSFNKNKIFNVIELHFFNILLTKKKK